MGKRGRKRKEYRGGGRERWARARSRKERLIDTSLLTVKEAP